MEDNYIPFGPEWEKEMMKLPKKFLIDMIRKRKPESDEKDGRIKELLQQIEELTWQRDELQKECNDAYKKYPKY